MPHHCPKEVEFAESYPKNPRGQKPTDVFRVVNPTNVDFAFEYLDASNQPVPYEMKAGQVRRWPRYLVCYYTTHFIDVLLNRQGKLTNDMNAREEMFEVLVLGPAEDVETPVAHAPVPETGETPKPSEPLVIQRPVLEKPKIKPLKITKPRAPKKTKEQEVAKGPPADAMQETRSETRAPNEPLSLGGGVHDLPDIETEA